MESANDRIALRFLAAPSDRGVGGSSVHAGSVLEWIDKAAYARAATSGCRKVSIQGMNFELAGDLTIVVDDATVTNGLTVTSADGEPHTVRLVVTGGDVTFSGTTLSDDAITTQVAATGRIALNGPAVLQGQLIGGQVQTTGDVRLEYRPVVTAGVTVD